VGLRHHKGNQLAEATCHSWRSPMKCSQFDESRTIDSILDKKQTIFEWELKCLKTDLSSLQKSVLIRLFCRNERISEIAAHLKKSETEIQRILDSAITRLEKHRNRLSKTGEMRRHDCSATHICKSCGTQLKGRFRKQLCHDCDYERKPSTSRGGAS
jgi:hypothetical protein